PFEEVRQRSAPLVGLESILLVNEDPRQLLPPPRQLVAAPRELLLRVEQLEPRCEPLFTCARHVLRHRCSLRRSGVLHRLFPSVPTSGRRRFSIRPGGRWSCEPRTRGR